MATYRLIHREAETGKRSSSLSDFGFCVWVSYQLAADDFGVCPATAAKLQGESPRLSKKSAKAVQVEIENLIATGLCGSFLDGPQRYLYQSDWQDWQRIKHATSTVLPPVPGELLEKCSPKTRALFFEFHPKIREGFPPHARACDANANAGADASGSCEGGMGETAAQRQSVASRASALGIVRPGVWHRQHGGHEWPADFCSWVCLPQSVVDGFAGRAGGGLKGSETDRIVRAAIREWALGVKSRWVSSGAIPGDDIFKFWQHEWATTHGTNKPVASPASSDPLAGLREAERRG